MCTTARVAGPGSRVWAHRWDKQCWASIRHDDGGIAESEVQARAVLETWGCLCCVCRKRTGGLVEESRRACEVRSWVFWVAKRLGYGEGRECEVHCRRKFTGTRNGAV
jgi:hypothetical protein